MKPFPIAPRTRFLVHFVCLALIPSGIAAVASTLSSTRIAAWFSGPASVAVATRHPWREAGHVVAHADGRGAPWISVHDGIEVPTGLAAKGSETTALSLATADLDEDGVPDLVSGYAGSNGGVVTVARGNVDAIYPNAPEAQARRAAGAFTDAPFLPSAREFALAAAPDFVATGDFDADGHFDVVTAHAGDGALFFMRGDGHGGLGAPEKVTLPGKVTTLVAGEIDAADALDDVVVGVTHKGAADLLVFRSRSGAMHATPETIELPGPATSLALGQFDDRYEADLAAAAGGRLVLVHGNNRLAMSIPNLPAPGPRVETIKTSFAVAALAAGNFTGDTKTELALLGADGAVRLWERGTPEMRPWGGPVAAKAAGSKPFLMRAKLSAMPHDDLVVADPASARLNVFLGDADPTRSPAGAPRINATSLPITFDVDGSPSAVVSMRLNVDALGDLVVLRRGAQAPIAITSRGVNDFTVNNSGDVSDFNPGDGLCDDGKGGCSLRAALEEAAAGSGSSTISFAIGTGAQTIQPGTPLPALTNDTTIDGTTQPGFSGAPLIEIDGSVADGNGLHVALGTDLIRGLVINGNIMDGIVVTQNAPGTTIEGCYIGTNAAGTAASANTGNGVHSDGSNLTVGGTVAAARNVISGNGADGVRIGANSGGFALVEGNYIGTNAAGSAAISNGLVGVEVEGVSPCIGTSSAGSGNVISGNTAGGSSANGIFIHQFIFNTFVMGNLIGLEADGSTALGNAGNGVLDAGIGTLIGGSQGNVISGNTNAGVLVENNFSGEISNNIVGLDASGTTAIPNDSGIEVSGVSSGTIGSGGGGGGGRPAAIDAPNPGGNVISGNTSYGIHLSDSSSIFIQDNFVGGGFDAMTAIGNGSDGILFDAGCTSDTVQANVVVNNGGAGVVILNPTFMAVTQNAIYNNGDLGIDINGDGVTPNDVPDMDGIENFPVIDTADFDGVGTVNVSGTIDAIQANTHYVVELFQNGSCDASGNGEGEVYLGSVDVTTDGTGHGTFSTGLSATVTPGDVVTATSTFFGTPGRGTVALATSEFSACKVINVPSADLNIVQQAAPIPISVGQDLTYTITLSNNGPADATNVVVMDTTPADTTFVSASAPAGWSTTAPSPGGTGTVSFTNPLLSPADGPQEFTMVVTIGAGATSILNTADAASDTFDSNTGNNSVTLVVAIAQPMADLSIGVSDSPDPVLAGQNISYTIDAANIGPDTAVNAVVTDATPANTTFVSASAPPGWSTMAPSVGGTGTITFTNPSFAADMVPHTFTIVVQVGAATADGTIITNSASIASDTTDPTASNNSANTTTTVAQPKADLSIGVSDAPDPVLAGQNITYTIDATNSGPQAAVNAAVSDTTPANTTFVSASAPAGWSAMTPAVGGTGTVTFTKASFASSAVPDSFTIVVKVGAATADGTIITNSASVASDTIDPSSGNNSANTTTTVAQPKADLSVAVSDAPDPVLAGQNITYTIDATNSGPQAAVNAAVTDTTPANTTFVSASAPAGWSTAAPAPGGTGTVTFTKASFASSAVPDTFTIVLKVGAATADGTIITNSVTVASDTIDPSSGNNSASTTTTVAQPKADLSIGVSDSPDPVMAGQNITYMIDATNSGPQAAVNAAVTDMTPANTTFVSASAPAGWSTAAPAPGGTGTVTFTKASFASSAVPDTFTIVLKVGAATPDGTIVTNSASVASDTIDPSSGNNSASTTTTVAQPKADLSIGVSDAPDPVLAGQNITYTIDVANIGPDTAVNAVVTDTTPASTTFVSASAPAGWSAMTPPVGGTGTVTFTNSSFAADMVPHAFTIVLKVGAATADGTIVTNSAAVASDTIDPTASNNSANTTTTVAQPMADLSVSVADAPDPVLAGLNITYSIDATNSGPQAAVNAVVTDATPANTTFVSASAPAGWSATTPPVGGTGTVTFTKASFASSAVPDTFTIVVKVGAATPDGTIVTNSVSAASDTIDPSSANNSASTTTTVAQPMADLSISVSDSPDPVLAGQNITYTIDAANAGPDTASGVIVSNPLPPNTTMVSAVAPPGWAGAVPPPGGTGTVSFTKTSLATTSVPETFTIVVKVDSGTADGTIVLNTVTIASDTADPSSGNNSANTATTVSNPAPVTADIGVTKTATASTALAGEDVMYTISVSNFGPADATGLTLTDAIPAHTTFRSLATPLGWSSDTPAVGGTGTITSTAPSLLNGTAAVFTLVVRIDGNAISGSTIVNSASATSATSDPDFTNNTDTATVTVDALASADLVISNAASPDEVAPGAAITYAISVTNQGPDGAANVVVTDQVPPNTTFVSATASTGATLATPAVGSTGTIQATWAGTTAANAELTLTIVVRVNDSVPDQTNISNNASVTSDTLDFDSSNNIATATSTVTNNPNTPMADLSITTSSVPTMVDTGTYITYTITVHNNGPDTAEDVVVMGSTPDGTRLVSIASTQGTTSGTQPGGQGPYTVDIGEIPNGDTVTITVVVNVVAPGGVSITNSATVASSTSDPTAGNNATNSDSTGVVAGNDTLLTWDPPLPCDDDCLNPPLHLQTSNVPPPSFTGHIVKALRNTVVGYNVYRSNTPNVQSTPANFFTTLPPSVTSLVAPTAPGGSFFTVTAMYPNGESGETNAASGGLPEPTITGLQIRGNKIIVSGSGFTDEVVVFVDGIPFKKPAKVRAADGTIIQKGKLLTGQRVSQYLAQQGGVILVSVLNTDSGIGTYLYRR